MTLAAGDRLGPYEIVSRIGAGGMGEVWRARDTRLDRNVAIKMLPAELAADAKLKVRFEREARAISQLNHPHICTLYDIGDGYLVMELLEGESLADRVARGPLPVSDVLRYGAQIADALGRAHRAGIVHRDLKPGNIVLTRGGAKLLDFGLAKSTQLEFSADGATQQKPLTEEGTIVGTYQYMAPEQLEGLDADPRSDLWALGAVLYEMATGRRAFEGKSRPSLIAAILTGEPPTLTELQPLAPPALEHVIAKCLSKSPDDRWQSAQDVAEELRWIGASSSRATAAIVRPRSRERWWWIAALAIVAVAAAIGALWLRPKREPEMLTLSLMHDPAEVASGGISMPAFSPDGKQVVYSGAMKDGQNFLFLCDLTTGTSQLLRDTAGGYAPFWSPDGRSIGFSDLMNGNLRRISLATGAVETLQVLRSAGCSWMPGDRILFASNGAPNSIAELALSSGERKVLFGARTIGAESVLWPSVLPDRNHFVFLAVGDALARQQRSGVWLATRDGSEPPRFLTAATSHAQYVEPGYLVFARVNMLWAQPFDLRHFRVTGDGRSIAPVVSSLGWYAFTVANNGLLLFQSLDDMVESQLVVKNRKGETVRLVGAPGQHYSPKVSPDGRNVAFDLSATTGEGDIWLNELTNPTGTRVSFAAENETAPVWSPHGDEIVYTLSRPQPLSGSSLVRKRLGGGSEVVLTVPFLVFASDWSPDGKVLLLFQSQSAWAFDLLAWSLTEKKFITVAATPAVEMNGVFSPDGKWVAYQSDESGRFEIYAQPFPPDGSKEQVSTSGGTWPSWRNGEISYVDPGGRLNVVKVTTSPSFHAAAPEALFAFNHPRDLNPYTMTPDGLFLINETVPTPPKPMTLLVNWTRRFDAH